jgi:hypothetical protein
MADSHEAFANVDEMVAKPVLGVLVTKIILFFLRLTFRCIFYFSRRHSFNISNGIN